MDDDEVRPDRGRAQVRRALQGQRGKPSVRPTHRDETHSMRRRLGRQPYQVPTTVLGVPTAREEWGAHRHVGAVRRLRHNARRYGIGWEGSDYSSDDSSSSSGSWSSGSDSTGLFSRKTRSLLESERGEEAVGREGSGGEDGPLGAAHRESMERVLAGGRLDSRDVGSLVGRGGGSPSFFLKPWPIAKPVVGMRR